MESEACQLSSLDAKKQRHSRDKSVNIGGFIVSKVVLQRCCGIRDEATFDIFALSILASMQSHSGPRCDTGSKMMLPIAQ